MCKAFVRQPSENILSKLKMCVNGLEHKVIVWLSELFAEGDPLHTNMFGYLLFVYLYFCLKNRRETCYQLADEIN